MTLTFPMPPAVRVLVGDLAEHGFDPVCELAADGSIVVSVAAGRVVARGVFHRRRQGYVLTAGTLLVDGLWCPKARSAAELRRIVDDPDGHLTKRKNPVPPPHVARMMASSAGKDEMRSIRAT